jgi:aminocarboxymuconate-semialdehyde decarboxylase
MIVDAHAHLFPGAWFTTATDGPVTWRAASETTTSMTVLGKQMVVPNALLDATAAATDAREQGCDRRAVMSPPFTVLYELDPDEGIRWARSFNDAMAAAVATEPTLLGYAMVPLQSGESAAVELRRAVEELGLVGAAILSTVAGRGLDDDALTPFWRDAAELCVPVFVHPHYVSGTSATEHLYLRNVVGNPTETAGAGARLVLGGVLDRFTGLNVVLAHGGGALPHLAGRLDRAAAVRAELSGTTGAPSALLSRLYYDTVVFDPTVLRHIGELVGFDRLTVGSDFPFDMGVERPVDFVRTAGLDEAQVGTVLGSRLWDRARNRTGTRSQDG